MRCALNMGDTRTVQGFVKKKSCSCSGMHCQQSKCADVGPVVLVSREYNRQPRLSKVCPSPTYQAGWLTLRHTFPTGVLYLFIRLSRYSPCAKPLLGYHLSICQAGCRTLCGDVEQVQGALHASTLL